MPIGPILPPLAATLLLLATCAPCADPLADAVTTELGVETLSPAQLDTLEYVVSHYRKSPAGPVLDPRALDEILHGVNRTLEEESPWEHLWSWLAGKLDEFGLRFPPGLQPTEIPRWVFELITMGLAVTVVAVVVNELRLRRWRPRVRPVPVRGASGLHDGAAVLNLDHVSGLPLREQPGAVLRIVLATLASRGLRLGGDGTTHREIAAGANRVGAPLGFLLARLAKMAELARYSRASPDEQGEALDTGRAILDGLPDGNPDGNREQ